MKRLEWKQRSRPDEGECLCCKPYKILRELCFGVSFQVFPFNIIIVTFLQECLFSKNFSDTSLHVYWTGVLSLPAVTVVANAGISVLNVQLPYQLMPLYTWGNQRIKIFTALTILRATVTISTKARCAWDSGSLIVLDTVEVMAPTQAGIQCPGSLLKKFLNLTLRSSDKTSIPT